jgi:Ricin-type beta-trefoil lectin domain-like
MESKVMAMSAGPQETPRRLGNRRLGRRRLAAGAAVFAAALGTAAALGVAPAHAATTAGNNTAGVYTITNRMTGMVADITGGSSSWLTPVDSWPSTNGENQKWRFVQVNPDYDPTIMVEVLGTSNLSVVHAYQIVSDPYSDGTPECLEAEGDTPTAGDGIDMYGCNPNSVDQPNQLWYPVTFNGRTELVNGISVTQNDGQVITVTKTGQVLEADAPAPTPPPALVMTPVGELANSSTQGNQLVLEPSDPDTYIWYQQWTVSPTEYAVDTPSVTIPGSSMVGHDYYYGCLNGWNPQTTTVNGDNQLTYRATTSYSDLYVTALPDSSSQDDLFDLVGPGWAGFGGTASSNGVEVEYANGDIHSGSAHIEFYCQPAGSQQLTS